MLQPYADRYGRQPIWCPQVFKAPEGCDESRVYNWLSSSSGHWWYPLAASSTVKHFASPAAMSTTASATCIFGDMYLSLCTYQFKRDRSTHILIRSDPFLGWQQWVRTILSLLSLVWLFLGLGGDPTPFSTCLCMRTGLFWMSWHKMEWHLVLAICETFLLP